MGNTASDRKNARCYSLKFSRNTDAELIEWLDSKGSIQGYLKDLIRTDMMKEEHTMKYQINLNGSPIDTVKAPAGYTAEAYIESCKKNADQEWCDMLSQGTATVDNVTEYHIKADYLPLWGSWCDENTVITYDEVENLAAEWDKTVDELLSQLEEI